MSGDDWQALWDVVATQRKRAEQAERDREELAGALRALISGRYPSNAMSPELYNRLVSGDLSNRLVKPKGE